MGLINNDLKTNFAEAREQLFAALRTDNEQEQKQAFENFVTGCFRAVLFRMVSKLSVDRN